MKIARRPFAPISTNVVWPMVTGSFGLRLWSPLLLLLAMLLLLDTSKISTFPAATAFLTTHMPKRSQGTPNTAPSQLYAYKPVVVVGKIIVDEYGDPFPDFDGDHSEKSKAEDQGDPAPPKTVTIGGGGPQAAFGALAALAVWDGYFKDHEIDTPKESLPPVVFVAPVGMDWISVDTVALKSCQGARSMVTIHKNKTMEMFDTSFDPASDEPIIQTYLVQGQTSTENTNNSQKISSNNGFFTPRIRLWHDEEQIVHWYALNDSFGPNGADGLWRNNPSAKDLVTILSKSKDTRQENGVVLHAIAETWTGAAGGQLDFLPLVQDKNLLYNHLSFIGIEPVASGESVTQEDAACAANVLHTCCNTIARSADSSRIDTVFWCPDRDLDDVLQIHDLYKDEASESTGAADSDHQSIGLTVAIRDGPRGSLIRNRTSATMIPAASLRTKNGAPLDPTGAGNAYSGSMTALLGNGIPTTIAACISSGVGAVVCEHEGLPPPGDWTKTLDRIASAAREVESKLKG